MAKQNDIPPYLQAQKHTFTNWVNEILREKGESISDPKIDFKDGLKLYSLYQQFTGKNIEQIDKKPKIKISALHNINLVIYSFKKDGLKLGNIKGEDIYNEKLKLILELLWMLIQKYHLGADAAFWECDIVARKLLADFANKLVKRRTTTNFKKDFQNGIILSELINEVQPNCYPRDLRPLINFDRIKKALDVAEKKLGVPKLIKPEFISGGVDEISLMTYVTYLMKKYKEKERIPYVPLCVASGSGLDDSSIMASPHSFQVELFNCYGSLCPIRLEELIQLKAKGPQEITFKATFKEDGVCLVDYEATTPGQYSIDVTVAPQKETIKNSPFIFIITNSNRKISGNEIPTEIDNPISSKDLPQQETPKIGVQDSKGQTLPVRVSHSNKNKYAGTHSSTRSGPQNMKVGLFGESIFSRQVTHEGKQSKDSVADSEPKTFLTDCERGVQSDFVADRFAFEVLSRDNNGWPKTTGGDVWEVEVKRNDGRYAAKFHLEAQDGGPSTFKVSATVQTRDDRKDVGMTKTLNDV